MSPLTIFILLSVFSAIFGWALAKGSEAKEWKDYARKRDEEMLELLEKHSEWLDSYIEWSEKLEMYEKQLIERGK